MKTIEVNDKKLWNDFVIKHGPKSGAFLHSWDWGEFQRTLGRKVLRIMVLSDAQNNTDQNGNRNEEQRKNIIVAAQLVKMPLPLGKSYFYCPRGPVVNSQFLISKNPPYSPFCKEGKRGIFDSILEKIKILSKKEGTIFFRFEPVHSPQPVIHNLRPAKTIQPRCSLLLDLTKSEEELMKGMRQKTRYNIGLAKRKGIRITFDPSTGHRASNSQLTSNQFEIFWKLLQETAKRNKFKTHPKKYYHRLIFSPSVDADSSRDNKLFFAYYQDKPLAAAMVNFFGNTATYLHGASSGEFRNFMAPYLLHWEIIRYAKERGYRRYDWWGIAKSKGQSFPRKDCPLPRQNWTGITRFKKGFADIDNPTLEKRTGIEICYPGTFDLPLDKFWYGAYRIVKNIA